jgi:hypothetical protein
MTAPTICAPCIEGECDKCLQSWGSPEGNGEFCVGFMCACGHGFSDSRWRYLLKIYVGVTREVIAETDEVRRAEPADS